MLIPSQTPTSNTKPYSEYRMIEALHLYVQPLLSKQAPPPILWNDERIYRRRNPKSSKMMLKLPTSGIRKHSTETKTVKPSKK
uniref:Uncharacterized protein n=1 Tax=Rhizophora mucronata TaxID=61149 RepID=A0A2P2PPP1_RHIMU